MQLVKVGSRIINLDMAEYIELGALDMDDRPCVKIHFSPASYDRLYGEEADALVNYLTTGYYIPDAMNPKQQFQLSAEPLTDEEIRDIPF